MKRFLCRLALFLLPVLLVVAAMFGALAASGEFCDVPTVAARMAAGESLRFELNYRTNATAQLKSQTAALRGADLLVVGTSRTMQFRQSMFPRADFYNAGGAVSKLSQVLPFLQSLPQESRPQTLLLGLDQYFFNAAWDSAVTSEPTYAPTVDTVKPLDALNLFLHHCGEGKVYLIQLLQADPAVLGVPARVRGSGFLSDGSYRYGTQADAAKVDPYFTDSIRRIATGTNRFEYGSQVSDGALAILTQLLDWCGQNGIRVVAYLPPYAPSVYAAMQRTGNYTYLDSIHQNILEIFDIYGGECYDYTYMENTVDAEFVDGFHAGDGVYCKMLLDMLSQNSALAAYTDAAALQALLANEENPRVLAYDSIP